MYLSDFRLRCERDKEPSCDIGSTSKKWGHCRCGVISALRYSVSFGSTIGRSDARVSSTDAAEGISKNTKLPVAQDRKTGATRREFLGIIREINRCEI
jgi:hypothetical protein